MFNIAKLHKAEFIRTRGILPPMRVDEDLLVLTVRKIVMNTTVVRIVKHVVDNEDLNPPPLHLHRAAGTGIQEITGSDNLAHTISGRPRFLLVRVFPLFT